MLLMWKMQKDNRDFFRQLKKLSVDIEAKNINNVSMSVLSMGMTGDYQVAVGGRNNGSCGHGDFRRKKLRAIAKQEE